MAIAEDQRHLTFSWAPTITYCGRVVRITPTGVKIRVGKRVRYRNTAFVYLDMPGKMNDLVMVTVPMTKWRAELGT